MGSSCLGRGMAQRSISPKNSHWHRAKILLGVPIWSVSKQTQKRPAPSNTLHSVERCTWDTAQGPPCAANTSQKKARKWAPRPKQKESAGVDQRSATKQDNTDEGTWGVLFFTTTSKFKTRALSILHLEGFLVPERPLIERHDARMGFHDFF